MPKRSVLLFVLAVTCALSSAPGVRAQEAGLPLLRIGVNAAAGGMGDAYVAYSRDAFSTFWNPAGLAAAPTNTLALTYHSWVADVQTYGLATRFRAGERGGLGLFITAMGSGDLEARERPGDPEGLFNVSFLSTGLAYGRQLGPLRAGATVKYLNERIYTDSANGYAFDVGLQVDVVPEGLLLGVAVQNMGEMTELGIEATPLPRTYRLGAAVFPLRIGTEDGAPLVETLVTAEVVHVAPTETTRFHAGVSARVFEVLDVRGGLITNDELRGLTLGLGLEYESFLFDYAYLPFENDFPGAGHILTLNYAW